MSDPQALVDHYFRHEYGRLVALLSRRFGIDSLELIEDVVQTALIKALQHWGQTGLPDDPSAWLYRTAQRLAIDAIRRRQVEQKILKNSHASIAGTQSPSLSIDEPTIDDDALRLLFLCCHPDNPLEASIALALRLVSGFNAAEVGRALLTSTANAEKRITRAREKLRSQGFELTDLNATSMGYRLETVHSTLYLLFNEGYASNSEHYVIRQDLCHEAIRLCRMLAQLESLANTATYALLALFLFLASRLDSRMDLQGCIVPLAEQDRTQWRWDLVREAMYWMSKSAAGEHVSRYHIESAIAWEHSRAESLNATDWQQIESLYRALLVIHPSPMVALNHALAVLYARGATAALPLLTQIDATDRSRLRPWWDCAIAEAYLRCGNSQAAMAHWSDAYRLAENPAQRQLIERKSAAVQQSSLSGSVNNHAQ